MHPNNFTMYQLVKYHIELTEALEYTLMTYKYDENELIDRLNFLNEDFKKGFYHKITKVLLKKGKALTKEIKTFIKKYKKITIDKMVNDNNLKSRINYNKDLYLAYSCSNNIINLFLNEERIKDSLDESLITLFNTTNKHFELFFVFNSLNLFASSKVALMSDTTTHELEEEDKQLLLTLVSAFLDQINQKELLNETINLINEKRPFNEDEAYETLNKLSIECIKAEKELYTDFETFTGKLEKEIEKAHNNC